MLIFPICKDKPFRLYERLIEDGSGVAIIDLEKVEPFLIEDEHRHIWNLKIVLLLRFLEQVSKSIDDLDFVDFYGFGCGILCEIFNNLINPFLMIYFRVGLLEECELGVVGLVIEKKGGDKVEMILS